MMKTQEQMCQQEHYNTILEKQLRLEQEYEQKKGQQEQYNQKNEKELFETPEEKHFLSMQEKQQKKMQEMGHSTEQYSQMLQQHSSDQVEKNNKSDDQSKPVWPYVAGGIGLFVLGIAVTYSVNLYNKKKDMQGKWSPIDRMILQF